MNFTCSALAMLLISNSIPFTFEPVPHTEGGVFRFPQGGDVACSPLTHGSAHGYVESYRFPWDGDDVTCLTPQEFISLYKNRYGK